MSDEAKKCKNQISLCKAPWKGISLRTNNYVSICANSSWSFLPSKSTRLSDLLNNSELIEHRGQHLKFDSNIKSCEVCTSREKIGFSSLKNYFENLPTQESTNLNLRVISPKDLAHLDINLSNVCNLKCRMCNFSRSSSWFEDQQLLSRQFDFVERPVRLPEPEVEIDIDIENLKNLRVFVLKGGEPLFDKKSLALLEKFVTTGLSSKVSMTIYTNGVYFNKNRHLLNEFKRLNLIFSFEGTGALYQYIRGGQNTFDELYDNIKISGSMSNIQTTLMYTPQSYNIFDWVNAIKFVEESVNTNLKNKLKQHDVGVIFGNILKDPQYLAVSEMPEDVKEKARSILEKSNYRNHHVIRNLLILLKQKASLENQNKFILFTKKLDLLRSESLFSAAPEFIGTSIQKSYDLCSV